MTSGLSETLNHRLMGKNLHTLRVPDWRAPDAFEAVTTPTISNPDDSVLPEIVRRYYAYGLVLLSVSDEVVDSESLRSFARSVGLGAAYTPPQYGSVATFANDGISRMKTTAASGEPSGEQPHVAHPSFHSTAGQSLHCDGTLEPIGKIRTSILACHEPAEEGGATTFLNITQAMHELVNTDPAAADALFDAGILRRTANIDGVEGTRDGEAFALLEGELVTRASYSSTDTWSISGDERGRDRARGTSWLLSHADEASTFFVRIRAQRNQLIMFANDRLAHGRDGYTNSPEQVRDMSRALFTTRPTEVF